MLLCLASSRLDTWLSRIWFSLINRKLARIGHARCLLVVLHFLHYLFKSSKKCSAYPLLLIHLRNRALLFLYKGTDLFKLATEVLDVQPDILRSFSERAHMLRIWSNLWCHRDVTSVSRLLGNRASLISRNLEFASPLLNKLCLDINRDFIVVNDCSG